MGWPFSPLSNHYREGEGRSRASVSIVCAHGRAVLGLACAAVQLLKSSVLCLSHKFLMKSSRILFSDLLCWFEHVARRPQYCPLGEGMATAGAAASLHLTPPRLQAVHNASPFVCCLFPWFLMPLPLQLTARGARRWLTSAFLPA